MAKGRRRPSKPDATGRNVTSRFARLDHRLLASNAYRALNPNARSLLTELVMLYNGENNGSLTALAPTASAATVLGEALGLRSDTVARHLLAPEARLAGNDAVWIVDEASMLSAHDMARLMTSADKAVARLVLVGDVKQLGSVGAGAAFAQLQATGMTTSKLVEVVRQTNAGTREAVLASIEGHAGKALAALDRGGGRVTEDDRAFLYSFETGDPAWDRFPLDGIAELPAPQFKLLNIRKFRQEQPLHARA